MTKKNSIEEAYQNAIADFGDEALSCDSSRGFDLTSVKAQYVKERMNEVFGFLNWTLTGEYQEVSGGVLYLGKLTVTVDGVSNTQEGVGYSANKKNMGDTFKGAQTDCLSKVASTFGVANEVFKGNVAPPGKGSKGGGAVPPKKSFKPKTAGKKW